MFRTELSLRPAAQLLHQDARVLTIGSCFSDVIGERLAGHKVRTLVNPFGTVFNPLAAARLLRAVAGEDTDWQQHLVEARGRWQSYDLHATVGADSPPELLERIEETVRETAEFARRADVLVWTLGTAYGHRLRDTGEVVNNCHKVPADRFEKELLTAEEIVSAVTEAYALLRQQNPKLRLVLTVSPVRHLKDTLPLNAVSKSVLRVACHYLSELLPGASYFPAYELLLDDLRDYRFYGADMIHPSEVAEQYVWEKFTGAYFDANFRQFVQEWDGIQRALNHHPLHDGAPEHREFLEQTQKRLQRLLSQHVDVRLELLDVQDRLDALPLPTAPAQVEAADDGEERIDVGYEDATVTPAAPKPVAEEEAPAPPKAAEPTWAEILSAEEAEEEEADEDDAEPAGGNEAEAALPGEPGTGKRRKRKRGGRKHKKKSRSAEEAVAADVEGADAPVSAAVSVEPAAETAELLAETSAPAGTAGTPALNAETSALETVPAEVVTAAPLPPVELPAADEPLPPSTSKRRNRPKRKKPALYTEQAADSPEELPAAEPAAEPETVEVEPAAVEPVAAPTEAASPQDPVAHTAVELTTAAAPAETTEAPAPAASVEPEAAPKAKSRRSNPRSPRKTSKAAPASDTAAETQALPEPLPELPAVVEAAVPEQPAAESAATTELAKPAPKRRAAPRRKPAAEAAPAAPEPAPAVEPTPAAEPAPAAPKKRSRPPRRKPDEPAAS